MSKSVLGSSITHRQTDRHIRKWIQRTPFQGFRNFPFNLSSRIGPIDAVWLLNMKFDILGGWYYWLLKCRITGSDMISSNWILVFSAKNVNCTQTQTINFSLSVSDCLCLWHVTVFDIWRCLGVVVFFFFFFFFFFRFLGMRHKWNYVI